MGVTQRRIPRANPLYEKTLFKSLTGARVSRGHIFDPSSVTVSREHSVLKKGAGFSIRQSSRSVEGSLGQTLYLKPIRKLTGVRVSRKHIFGSNIAVFRIVIIEYE